MENKRQKQKYEEDSFINDKLTTKTDIIKIRDEIINNDSENIQENPQEGIHNVSKDFKVDCNDSYDKFNVKNEYSDEDNNFITDRLNDILKKPNKEKQSKDKMIIESESELENYENLNFDSFNKINEAKDLLIDNNKVINILNLEDKTKSNFLKNQNKYGENNKIDKYEMRSDTSIVYVQEKKETNPVVIQKKIENMDQITDKDNSFNLNDKRLIHPYSNNHSNDKIYNQNIINNPKEEFPNTSFHLQSENFKIDTHLDKIGYSIFHYRMLIIVSLVFFVDGCEMSNVNMLLSSIQKDLNLNTFQKSSLSSAIFIGFFIGSFLSGFTTNKYGRLKPIKYGMVLIFVFSFLTSISKSIVQLIMMRILSGLAIGTVVPACKTLITESIPSFYRSFVLSIVWILLPVATVYICIIALYCDEGNEFNWRKVFLINSLNSFILIILVQFLTESPRFLLKNGKSQEAIELLDLMGNSNIEGRKVKLNEKEKNMIYVEASMMQGMDVDEHSNNDTNANSVPSVKQESIHSSQQTNVSKLRIRYKNSENSSSINETGVQTKFDSNSLSTNNSDSTKDKDKIFLEEKYTKVVNIQCNLDMLKFKKKVNTNSVKLLFSKKYLSTSALLFFIWFSTSFVSFGLFYSLPKLFEKVSNNSKQDSMKKMIKTMLMVTPSAIIRGYISELKFLGRKHTLALGFLGAFINSIICFSMSHYLHFFSGMLKFSIHISSGTVSIYTSEVYPTEIRSLAIGFGTSITRIGAFLSSFACEIFDGLTPKGSFMLFAITSFISWICSISLKYETLGKPLDFEADNDEDDNLNDEENPDLKIKNKDIDSYLVNENIKPEEKSNSCSLSNKSIYDENQFAKQALKNMII